MIVFQLMDSARYLVGLKWQQAGTGWRVFLTVILLLAGFVLLGLIGLAVGKHEAG